MKPVDIDELLNHIHDKSFLARAITLVESSLPQHQVLADQLMAKILKLKRSSLRIGISGVPGVGKSTLINQLGVYLISKGFRVAVLAVDPSSDLSGGSILGDKTRMTELTQMENAFVRPSPNRTYLGGVTSSTRQSLHLCEASGYDIILIETVGVGQSETLVSQMVDCFVVLLLAGAGDGLQTMKKGILELGDLFCFTKCDGDHQSLVQHSQSEMSLMMKSFSHRQDGWNPPVLTQSSLRPMEIHQLWEGIQSYDRFLKENDLFEKKRKQQDIQWMWSLANEKLLQDFHAKLNRSEVLQKLSDSVLQGTMSSLEGAYHFIRSYQQELMKERNNEGSED